MLYYNRLDIRSSIAPDVSRPPYLGIRRSLRMDSGVPTDFHHNDRLQNVRRKSVRSHEIQDRKPDFAARKSHFTGNASSEKRIGKNLRKNGQIGRKVFRSDKRQ